MSAKTAYDLSLKRCVGDMFSVDCPDALLPDDLMQDPWIAAEALALLARRPDGAPCFLQAGPRE